MKVGKKTMKSAKEIGKTAKSVLDIRKAREQIAIAKEKTNDKLVNALVATDKINKMGSSFEVVAAIKKVKADAAKAGDAIITIKELIAALKTFPNSKVKAVVKRLCEKWKKPEEDHFIVNENKWLKQIGKSIPTIVEKYGEKIGEAISRIGADSREQCVLPVVESQEPVSMRVDRHEGRINKRPNNMRHHPPQLQPTTYENLEGLNSDARVVGKVPKPKAENSLQYTGSCDVKEVFTEQQLNEAFFNWDNVEKFIRTAQKDTDRLYVKKYRSWRFEEVPIGAVVRGNGFRGVIMGVSHPANIPLEECKPYQVRVNIARGHNTFSIGVEQLLATCLMERTVPLKIGYPVKYEKVYEACGELEEFGL